MKFKVRKEEEGRLQGLGGGWDEEKPDREIGGMAGVPLDDGTHLRDGAMAICLFYFSGPDPGLH